MCKLAAPEMKLVLESNSLRGYSPLSVEMVEVMNVDLRLTVPVVVTNMQVCPILVDSLKPQYPRRFEYERNKNNLSIQSTSKNERDGAVNNA